jgi:chromosome segregation ATPase
MPTNDYKDHLNINHYCIQEARLTAIETKLENKREHIKEVDDDYYHLRDKLETISENVVKLTAILEEAQKKEESNDIKLDNLKTEIANLKTDIANSNTKIEKTNSSLDTIRWLIPISCAVLTVILNYFI